jgi:hypothetical protein
LFSWQVKFRLTGLPYLKLWFSRRERDRIYRAVHGSVGLYAGAGAGAVCTVLGIATAGTAGAICGLIVTFASLDFLDNLEQAQRRARCLTVGIYLPLPHNFLPAIPTSFDPLKYLAKYQRKISRMDWNDEGTGNCGK